MPDTPISHRGNPIAVSSYSFWHFSRNEKPNMLECLDHAARMGFDAFEVLEVQMETREWARLKEIKRRALHAGLALCGLSTHQGFVNVDADVRQENVHKTIESLELAYDLGIPTMRVNTGRWGTITSFDDFMAAGGIEPTPEGESDEEAFGWVIDCFGRLAMEAEKRGVVMGLENHWGLGRSAEGVIRIVEAVNSPWLRATLDTGNFLEDQLTQYRAMAPYACFVQAKTYMGGGEWYTLDIDYFCVAQILREAGYRGYISLEFEGKADAMEAVPESLALLRRAFGPAAVGE